MGRTKYVVEKILDSKMQGRKKYYLIKWQNYPNNRNSWEPEEDLKLGLAGWLLEYERAEEQKQETERLKEQIRTLSSSGGSPGSGGNRKRGVEPYASHGSEGRGAEKKTKIETEVKPRREQEVPQFGRDHESMKNDEDRFSVASSSVSENGASLVSTGSIFRSASSNSNSTDQALPMLELEQSKNAENRDINKIGGLAMPVLTVNEAPGNFHWVDVEEIEARDPLKTQEGGMDEVDGITRSEEKCDHTPVLNENEGNSKRVNVNLKSKDVEAELVPEELNEKGKVNVANLPGVNLGGQDEATVVTKKEIDSLKAALLEKNDEIEVLKSELNSYRGGFIKILNVELDRLAQEKSALEEVVTSRDTKIEELKIQNEKLTRDYNKLELARARLLFENRLKNRHIRYVSSQKIKLAKSDISLRDQRKKLAALSAENSQLKSDQLGLENNLEVTRQDLERLDESLAAKMEILHKAREKIDKLEITKMEIDEQMTNLKERYEEQEGEYERELSEATRRFHSTLVGMEDDLERAVTRHRDELWSRDQRIAMLEKEMKQKQGQYANEIMDYVDSDSE